MTTHAKATYEELEEQLRRLRTELHSLRWLLGLETHEGEEPQSREDSHRNLDALLDKEQK